jgi:hypothetical protein
MTARGRQAQRLACAPFQPDAERRMNPIGSRVWLRERPTSRCGAGQRLGMPWAKRMGPALGPRIH